MSLNKAFYTSIQSYDYALPEELIAKKPTYPRDHCRLMLVDRQNKTISHHFFYELDELLSPLDSLVLNDTKVIPARLIGNLPSGGKAEILLCEQITPNEWIALVKPGKKLKQGREIFIAKDFKCTISAELPDGRRKVAFEYQGEFFSHLEKYGKLPIPPYIRKGKADSADLSDYQTIYAKAQGSIAAPTAGLHFTKELFSRLNTKGITTNSITLHVGIGTFLPVQTENIQEHSMHKETVIISKETASSLNKQRLSRSLGGREICVGTTSCRALESAADHFGEIRAGCFETDIFIYPGYSFKRMQALLTNFHLPKSTLLMLVSAFAGYDLTQKAYQEAIQNGYRFFSYGDAMLII